MFKAKQFQSKEEPNNKKPKPTSKSFSHQAIDSYFQKTNQTHFQIYLNSGVKEYEFVGDHGSQNPYASSVDIYTNQEFLQNMVKAFSSIYSLDHKAFEWRDKVDGLVKVGKEVVKVMDRFRMEVKEWKENKKGVEELQKEVEKVKEDYEQLKYKYDQLVDQSGHHLPPHNQEITLLNQKILSLQQQLSQSQQDNAELLKFREENQLLMKENILLNNKVAELKKESQELKYWLKKIRDVSFSEGMVKQMMQKCNLDDEQHDTEENSQHILPSQLSSSSTNLQPSLLQTILLASSPTIASTLISFLPPQSITSLLTLNKPTRFFLLHTPSITQSIFSSITNYKNFQIAFFHRHISHFQKQLKKIPEESVQESFYRFSVLKENIGGDFMQILSLCAGVFEGKVEAQKMGGSGSYQNKTVKEYIESKEILHFVGDEVEVNDEELYLKVDKQIVQQFFQLRRANKGSIMKQIEQMTQKLSTTQSMYSIDTSTLTQFHSTLMRHFSLLYVLSSHLFQESRNLQNLNTFLLSQLSDLSYYKIRKEYDLEDIKTELESSNSMIVFLSERCQKSEERVLRLDRERVGLEGKLREIGEQVRRQRERGMDLEKTVRDKEEELKRGKDRLVEIRGMYNLSKDKYNRLVGELCAVKESILNLQ